MFFYVLKYIIVSFNLSLFNYVFLNCFNRLRLLGYVVALFSCVLMPITSFLSACSRYITYRVTRILSLLVLLFLGLVSLMLTLHIYSEQTHSVGSIFGRVTQPALIARIREREGEKLGCSVRGLSFIVYYSLKGKYCALINLITSCYYID